MSAPPPFIKATADLRDLVRREVAESGWRQVEISRELGISEKHLSQMLTGKVGMTADWAAAILFVCGRVLVFATTPTPNPAFDAT